MSEQTDSSDMSGGHRRACDQCRARKIRCDKGPGPAPCSGCRTAQRDCRSTHLASRSKEVKHRVLISQHERKIDQFETRLAGIEGLLQDLNCSLSSLRDGGEDHGHSSGGMRTYTSPSGVSDANTAYEEQPSAATPGRQSKNTHAVTLSATSIGDDPSLFEGVANFEGTSSMTAQTAYASEFVEQAVTGNTPMQMDSSMSAQPDMRKALVALRKMAQQQQHRGNGQISRSPSKLFSRQKLVPRGGVCQLPLPPADVVLKLLREIRVTPPLAFKMSCSFLDVDDFIEACRDVYFATEDFGLSRFIIVNGGLFYLFEEKAATHKGGGRDSERAMFTKYQRLCGDNLETALANLPLFLPPSGEMVEALVVGVTYAIESSKFTLAWQLNSAAAAMCQTLGWHHVAPSPSDNKGLDSLRPGAFWFCYMIDKGLALRFGRTCVLPDWDISTPRDFFHGKGSKHIDKSTRDDPDNDPDSLNRIFNVWIRTGDILSQTYEHLYSPAALARSSQERADTARKLGSKAKQIWSEFEQLSPSSAFHDKFLGERSSHPDAGGSPDDWRRATLKRVLLSGQVGHLATLTLIYRAIPHERGPSSPFSSVSNSSLHAECISAARGAFRCHQACMALAADDPVAQVGHLHWTVLYSPFTPLIVLFCHVIETANQLRQARTSFVKEITSDLAQLEAFAASLQPLLSLSPAIARLHGLSRLLHQLATMYVQAKKAEDDAESAQPAQNTDAIEQDGEMQVDWAGIQGMGTDLGLYLSQLGFLPDPNSTLGSEALETQQSFDRQRAFTVGHASTGVMNPASAVGDPSINAGQPRLEEWFSGNTYVMGLVEDDLFDFGWNPLTGVDPGS
ncbi:hypothetical protein SEUCBS140593_009060 [Sporothrix eucalyptigena]|uniref:Zn(2)-C6 fungal-type domain-containing protein n=1 Tax=Sporothrix eucalyptigena TaxID=1812306 RepID=A0ABP0CUA9_9PEZI